MARNDQEKSPKVRCKECGRRVAAAGDKPGPHKCEKERKVKAKSVSAKVM